MKINLRTTWTECNTFLRNTPLILSHFKFSSYTSSSNDSSYRMLKLHAPLIYTIGAGDGRLETYVCSANSGMDTIDRQEDGPSVQVPHFTRIFRVISCKAFLPQLQLRQFYFLVFGMSVNDLQSRVSWVLSFMFHGNGATVVGTN
jgi:hypothetical protein